MSSLSQATPALISLKVHRTADEIMNMNTRTTPASSVAPQPTSMVNIVNKQADAEDHSEEIKTVYELLEQQCFSLVAFRNTIHDAREVQESILHSFHRHADNLRGRLSTLSYNLTKKVQEMNHRIDLISNTISPKPIFRRLQPPNEYGRITGIDAYGESIALTMATGHLVVLNRETFEVEVSWQPFDNHSLFSPVFMKRQNVVSLFAIASNGALLCSTPYTSEPVRCLEEKIECFGVADDTIMRDGFDLAVGVTGGANFYSISPEDPHKFTKIGETKGLRGAVTQIVVDNEHTAVYVLTSRRSFYSISASSYQLITTMQFQTPVMQLAMTRLFIVVSCAPNDVILAERSREKFNKICKFEVTQGLRRLFCSDKEILIIDKHQSIQARKLCKPLEAVRVCEPEAADYDPTEYIGAIKADGGNIYVSHGNRLSVWS